MTLPFEDATSETESEVISTYSTGRSTVVEQHEDGDVIRTARTKRDGTVITATGYALQPRRSGKTWGPAPDEVRVITADEAMVDPVSVPGYDTLGYKAGEIVPADQRQPIRPETHGVWEGMEDFANAPPSYDVFDKQYRSFCRHLVWTMGVAPRELDDVTQEIMIRFLERDSLGKFRREWVTRSKTKKSVFRSYFARFVVTYARGKHRNNVRFSKRFPMIVDAPVGDDGATTWLDQHDQREEGIGRPQETVELSDLIASLRREVGDDAVSAVEQLVEDGKKVTLSSLAGALSARTGQPVSARRARTTLESLRAAATSAMS